MKNTLPYSRYWRKKEKGGILFSSLKYRYVSDIGRTIFFPLMSFMLHLQCRGPKLFPSRNPPSQVTWQQQSLYHAYVASEAGISKKTSKDPRICLGKPICQESSPSLRRSLSSASLFFFFPQKALQKSPTHFLPLSLSLARFIQNK